MPESDEPTWVEESASDPAAPVADDSDESDGDAIEPAAANLTTVRTPADVRGVAAPASTTLTDGVYDEIRRLRSKVSDG